MVLVRDERSTKRVPDTQPDRATHWHRPLMALAAAMAATCVVTLVGLAVDDRVIAGQPLWLKPFKFTVSVAAYAVTLAWLLSLQTKARRLGWWTGTVIAGALAVDMILVVAQPVFRGRQLHFNHSTPVDVAMNNALAGAAYLIWAATLVLAVAALFQRLSDRASTLAVRYGLALALVGMGLGMLMIMPTEAQNSAIDAGHEPGIVGAHSVGVQDGGPGMPVTNWSTTGGDLRIVHFVGLHALQALPLVAILFSALRPRFPRLRAENVRARLVHVSGAGYAGLIGVLLWQALRAEPLLHPSGPVVAAYAAVVLGTGGLAAIAVLSSTDTSAQ